MKDILGLLVLVWPLTLLVLIAITFFFVVPLAVKHAEKHGRSKWRWGVGAFLLVYLPIFWDWIPTVAVHQFYCAKDSGFWVYKTLEQWKVENPGGTEGLVAEQSARSTRIGDDENHTDTQPLNQRFNWITERHHLASPLPVYSMERKIIDTEKGAVIARHVDYSTGKGRDYWKFWISNGSCPDGITNRNKLYHVVELIVNINKGEIK